ncbi:MAG: hypothetical protein C0507_14000 [Cyanobacteria bacterium PR.3.49]|nr:hypothetical protein [Cyanobacteria bacterium PR.3.49]
MPGRVDFIEGEEKTKLPNRFSNRAQKNFQKALRNADLGEMKLSVRTILKALLEISGQVLRW